MKTHFLAAALWIAAVYQLPGQITISVHPTSQVVSLGAHVTNTVTAFTTVPPITYQWYGQGTLLPDQTNRTLVLKSVSVDQAGEYYVVVKDDAHQPVQSNPATLTVDPTFQKLTEGPVVEDVEETETSVWWDFDNDQDLDLTVQVGSPHGAGGLQSFYRNEGNWVFTKIATNAIAQSLKRGEGGVAGDVDNDGDLDLFLGSNAWQANEPRCDLFVSVGNGDFSIVAEGPWRQEILHTFDPSFADINGDGLLDIFVLNYDQPAGVYLQTPAGRFVKATAAQVGSILGNPGKSYNAAWVDFDNDGDLDLWTEHYQGLPRLHKNNGRGVFTFPSGVSFLQSPGGMGVWADFDNDGQLELFVGGDTESGARPNALYRQDSEGQFRNVAAEAGVGLTMATWGSSVGDFDNDGWLDIFALHWYVGAANPAKTNVLFHNRGDGTFEAIDVGSPIRDGQDLRVTARWVDVDNDGFLDLFMACGTADGSTRYPRLNHLYRNNLAATQSPNRWVKVKLTGQASNRSGIGAKIRVKATIAGKEIWQVRELTGNGMSETCPGLIAHFGLGDATQAEVVRVEWPSGNVQEYLNVSPNQTLSVTEQVFITPVRPSASLGGSVTLVSQLTGDCQWYHDGVALEGKTAKTLPLSAITAADAGRYSVAVITPSGTVTNHVYLLVDTQFERIEMGDTVQSWGAAWGDYNNDNYPDLIVCNGQWVSTGTAALYRNNQDGTLVRTTPAEAGPLVEWVRNWEHAHWGDYDNDGYLDLIASDNNINPRPSLWRNLGNGRFEETTTQAGSFLEDRLWGVPIWGDFNRDGMLDLAVANTSDDPPQWPDWCRNLLYFNQGDGTFMKDTRTEFVQFWKDFNTEGGTAGDFDDDGDLDIIITSNSNRPLASSVLLFENDGTGQFRPAAFPTVSGASSTAVWADYDNDGRLDVFVVSWDRTSQLFRNEGNGQWTATPLGAPNQTLSAAWADYDNDGDLDLFVARGFNTTTTSLFFANNGDGTFTQVRLGSLPNHPGRSVGGAWADYDNNGFQDLFVPGAKDFREVLYRNHGNGNHWISFKLIGTRANRSAIGAKVRVYATIFGKTYWQLREVGGFSRQQNDLRPHFGLGNATRATMVRVQWPSGAVENVANLAGDQFHTMVEPSLQGAIKPSGEFALNVWASTNRVCTIEHSSDLAAWTVLTNVTGQGESPVSVTDPGAPGQSHRFYRMK
jgi:hypothetical protein